MTTAPTELKSAPGEALRALLARHGIGVADASMILGESKSSIYRLIRGKSQVSPRMAKKLAELFPTVSAMEWMTMDFPRLLAIAEEKRRRNLPKALESARALVRRLERELAAQTLVKEEP